MVSQEQWTHSPQLAAVAQASQDRTALIQKFINVPWLFLGLGLEISKQRAAILGFDTLYNLEVC